MAIPAENLRYTFSDRLTWEGDERFELIDGEACLMSSPSRIHQKICGELFRQIGNFLEGKKCEVYPAPFAVRLFEQDGDAPENVDTVVEPDVTVVCDPGKLDDRGCKGAPDMVIEILSPSTLRHDRFTKYNLYQRAGVREYWIMDPEGKTAQAFVLEDGRYAAKGFGTAGDILKVNALDGCFVELSKVFTE